MTSKIVMTSAAAAANEFTGQLQIIARMMTRKNGISINEATEALGYVCRPKIYQVMDRSSFRTVKIEGKDGLTRYAFEQAAKAPKAKEAKAA